MKLHIKYGTCLRFELIEIIVAKTTATLVLLVTYIWRCAV